MFDFPLEIGLALPGSGDLAVETIRISQKMQKYHVKTGIQPDPMVLDPHVKLLFADISRK